MNQEQYNEILGKRKEWVWKEILKVDPKEEFARRKTPKEVLPCCYRPLTTEERSEIRNAMKFESLGRVYNDKLQGLKGYSILVVDAEKAVVLAEKLELKFPVKCYMIPYVQWEMEIGSCNFTPGPHHYIKLRVVWRRF